MKSKNPFFFAALLFLLYLQLGSVSILQAQSESAPEAALAKIILQHDSTFWNAYNRCDVETMGEFFTDDLEFYHDRSGLVTPKEKFVKSMSTGLCGNENSKLRRVEISGTLRVFPMNDYGALLTGEHVFYIVPKDGKEYLDGYGKFTHLWRQENGKWKMARVLSYDHGPPPADFNKN